MRLVLFIERDGGYECSSWTEVLPFEYKGQEEAWFDLIEEIESLKKKKSEYNIAWEEWLKESPGIYIPKHYTGTNKSIKQKNEKHQLDHAAKIQEWRNKQPKPINLPECIFFGGIQIFWPGNLTSDDIVVKTLDEWYKDKG